MHGPIEIIFLRKSVDECSNESCPKKLPWQSTTSILFEIFRNLRHSYYFLANSILFSSVVVYDPAI